MKQYFKEQNKIYQMIYERGRQITKNRRDMVAVESKLQATFQLMKEEKLPLILLEGSQEHKIYLQEQNQNSQIDEVDEFLITCMSKGLTIPEAIQELWKIKPKLKPILDEDTKQRLKLREQRHKEPMKQNQNLRRH